MCITDEWTTRIRRQCVDDDRGDDCTERVLLVGVGGQRNDEGPNEYGLEDSLSELGQLAETAGLQVVGSLTQRMRAPHPGKGTTSHSHHHV